MSKNNHWKFNINTSKLTLEELEHLERSMQRSLFLVQLQIAMRKKKKSSKRQKKTSP